MPILDFTKQPRTMAIGVTIRLQHEGSTHHNDKPVLWESTQVEVYGKTNTWNDHQWLDRCLWWQCSLYHNQSPLPKCLPLETPLARLLMINCTIPASYNMLQLHTSQCHLAKHLAYNRDILLKPIFFLSSRVEHTGRPENITPIQLHETILCFWRYWLLTLPSQVPPGNSFCWWPPINVRSILDVTGG